MFLNLKRNKLIFSAIAILIICLIPIYHFYYICSYSLDFPFQDDTLLIDFIGIVKNSKLTFFQFLKELFRVANDHRLVIPRLVAFIDYTLNGRLNFKTYIIIANINLLFILLFLFHEFWKKSKSIIYFLPVPFFLFQPQMYEVSIWSLTGLQHTYVVTFMVLIITLLQTKKKVLLPLAIVCAFGATFTHGNGILVFPAAFFMLLVQQRYKEIVVWVIAMFTCLYLYLLGYESGQSANPIFSIVKIIESFCGFIGANMIVFFHGQSVYAVVYGAIIILLLGFIILIKIKKSIFDKDKTNLESHIGLLTLFCLIICTAGVISIVRSWNGIVISSRFALYAALSSCILYLVFLDYIRNNLQKFVGASFIAFSFAFWLFSYYIYSPIVDNKYYSYRADEYNWIKNRTMLSVSNDFMQNAMPYMKTTYTQKIWTFSDYWSQSAIQASLANPSSDSRASFIKTISKEEEKYPTKSIFRDIIELRCENIDFVKKSPNDGLYIVLTDKHTLKRYLIATTSLAGAKKNLFKNWSVFSKGFTVFIRTPSYEKGRYQVGYLIHHSDGTCSYHLTTTSLDI